MGMLVKGKCVRENFKNGEYRIFAWSPIGKYENLKLSPYFTFGTKGNDSYIEVGKEYEIELEEISYNPKFGATYKILSCPSLTKIDLAKLSSEEKYEILMGCTSSERIANNILAAYPNFIDKVLTEGKESIDLSLIKGVGEAYLNAYVRNLNEKYKYYNMLQDLNDYKVNVGDCKILVDRYGNEEEIQKQLNDDPYNVLHNLLRRSFEKCDEIILACRPNLKVSTQRCACLITCVLEKNEESGSTRLNGNDLYNYIMEEYRVPELEPLIVDTVTNSQYFYYDEESKDVSSMATYLGECAIKEFVMDKINNSTQLDIDWQKYTVIDDFHMTEDQGSALEMFCKYNFMILAGYSGSGKTTSIKGIIELMEDNGMSYTLLSPTGKASMRITESVHRPASTIHRKCLRDKEISSDVLIVDETSMCDLPTFNMMLNCIVNDNIRVIVVGDNAQLMPVGIGCVFNDLINSGVVPMVMLDKIFRYDTNGGLFVATNVRQGKTFFDNTDMVKVNGNVYSICNNYKFVCTEDIFGEIIKSYLGLINKGVKAKDILCLSPWNVGDVGSYKINNAIQAEVNPPKANDVYLSRKVENGKTEIKFRLGDKVINKKNDYRALPLESYKEIQESDGMLTEEDVKTTSIFNGQEGLVRQVTDKILVAQFDEELIVFDKAKVNNLLLGYCISVHSSQGSEAPYVMNVLCKDHKRSLNRNLLYVADTRAKKMQIDIGDMATYNEALAIDGNAERSTWLKELLEND